jgi:plasmid stabilization system protein ParE
LAEVTYYNQAQPGQGEQFAAAVEEATARALAFPLAGSLGEHNTRRVLLKKFPFSVIYRPEPDGIVVFAVAHQSRLPGYWRSRSPAR